jgi:hypothetical protein
LRSTGRSGQVTPCVVTTPAGELVIDDTYWTEDDYAGALRGAGLTITAIDYPMRRDPSAWSTDEALLSPCIVLTAVKARRGQQAAGVRPADSFSRTQSLTPASTIHAG